MQKNENTENYVPTMNEAGFHIVFETPVGNVGMWSCWLKDQFYISYPYHWEVSNELIISVLGVVDAVPVHYRERIRGNEYRNTTRLWGDFFGNRIKGGGRVWVSHEKQHAWGRYFPIIVYGKLNSIYYGHEESMSISTENLSRFSEEEMDGPNSREYAIQPYRDKFIELAIRIANENGRIRAVHVEYEFTKMTPKLLETLGYTEIRYLEGSQETVEVGGEIVIHATKGNEEIILNNSNIQGSWNVVRKINVSSEVTVKDVLNKFLVF